MTESDSATPPPPGTPPQQGRDRLKEQEDLTAPQRPETRRGRGRPRDPEADDAIMKAALELFVERGLDGTSIEQIARRAGVARVTVYRRWSSKEELLAQAIESARTVVPEARIWAATDQLSPQPDERLMESWVATLANPEFRTVLAQLIGASTSDPSLLAAYWEQYILPRRQHIGAILERAKQEGRLDTGTDVDALMDMVVGAAMYRMLIHPGPRDAAEMRRYLDGILRQTSRLFPRE